MPPSVRYGHIIDVVVVFPSVSPPPSTKSSSPRSSTSLLFRASLIHLPLHVLYVSNNSSKASSAMSRAGMWGKKSFPTKKVMKTKSSRVGSSKNGLSGTTSDVSKS